MLRGQRAGAEIKRAGPDRGVMNETPPVSMPGASTGIQLRQSQRNTGLLIALPAGLGTSATT
jgi:hypothetical protein